MKQRIDKWLWTVRLYKTRSQAARACRGGKVKIGDDAVKPAKEVEQNDRVTYAKKGVKYTVKVLDLPKNRVGAPIARECYEDLTPQAELDKLKKHPQPSAFYPQYSGKGRPTKKERRQLDEYLKKKRKK